MYYQKLVRRSVLIDKDHFVCNAKPDKPISTQNLRVLCLFTRFVVFWRSAGKYRVTPLLSMVAKLYHSTLHHYNCDLFWYDLKCIFSTKMQPYKQDPPSRKHSIHETPNTTFHKYLTRTSLYKHLTRPVIKTIHKISGQMLMQFPLSCFTTRHPAAVCVACSHPQCSRNWEFCMPALCHEILCAQ
jgi:hypothetical protein